ncbi:hypothetical protein FKM82_003385 [Ascaphus truei]
MPYLYHWSLPSSSFASGSSILMAAPVPAILAVACRQCSCVQGPKDSLVAGGSRRLSQKKGGRHPEQQRRNRQK